MPRINGNISSSAALHSSQYNAGSFQLFYNHFRGSAKYEKHDSCRHILSPDSTYYGLCRRFGSCSCSRRGCIAAPGTMGMPATLSGPMPLGSSSATGLPAVITEKGAATLPSGEATLPPAPAKEGGGGRGTTKTVDIGGAVDSAGMSAAEQNMSADESTGTTRPQPFRVGKLVQYGYRFFQKIGCLYSRSRYPCRI